MDVFGNPRKMPEPFARKMPPPPPGLPIDDNLIILITMAIIFGIYVIYNQQAKTKKTPI